MKKLISVVLCMIIVIFSLTEQTEGAAGEESSINYEEPSKCNRALNETFSWVALSCVKCQWNSEELPNSCLCPPGYAPQKGGTTVCERCPQNTMLYDGRHCLGCGSLNPFSLTSGKCSPCPAGHVEVAYYEDGSLRRELECVRCTEGFQPAPSRRECIPCHSSFLTVPNGNGTCNCPESSHSLHGGICFATEEFRDSSVEMKAIINRIEYDGFKVDSPLFRGNLVASFHLCKSRHNQTACQMLANMCTLNLHTYSDELSVCRLYRSTIGTGSVNYPPPYIPKLYYADSDAPLVLIRSSTILHTHDTKYDQPSSDVNITVAKFSFTGEFLGLSELEDIIPCEESRPVLRAGRKFGLNFRSKCQIGLKDMWNKFNGKTFFFDPYVSYEETKGRNRERHLHPLPIKIQNFKKNGVKVNVIEDKYQWQLVRRFFVIDTISSGPTNFESDDNEGNTFSGTVRYLERLHVRIQLQSSKEPGKIYVPLVTLTYGEASFQELKKDASVTFDYSVDYVMDMSRSIEDVKISIGVLSALGVLWGAIQAWSWNRRNGQLEIDLTTILNLLIASCGNLADTFFIVCFCTAAFWFALFKKQAAVHVFLPDSFQERLVRDLLVSAFSLKIVAIFELIRRQSTIDIFFVDWERPKVRSTIENHQSGEGKDKMGEESVSIWRTYFIANEWNEIQTTRKVHIATQLMATIFFLEVMDFKIWGLHSPHDDTLDPQVATHVPYSTSARFVVATCIFCLLGIIQWIYRVGFHERYVANKIQDFVDLCTMGNISVFILAAKQYGFYIHGRSVHGFADTNMQTMIEQLQREEEDLCGRRGLLSQTDQQTFLISVPAVFRNVYNQVLQPLYATATTSSTLFSRGKSISGSKGPAGVASATTGIKPPPTAFNLSVHAYNSMNRFLTAFLEHALTDLDYDVMKKTFFESLLDMEFHELGSDRAVFYTDDGHSFDSVLFYSHERTLFLFNLYTFIFVDILSHNYVLAAVIVFIMDTVLKCLRNFLGKRNLARKTLIDGRFLI